MTSGCTPDQKIRRAPTWTVRGSFPCANVTLPNAGDDADVLTPAPLSPAPYHGVLVRLKTSPRSWKFILSLNANILKIDTDAVGGRRLRKFSNRGLRLLSVNEGCMIHAAGSLGLRQFCLAPVVVIVHVLNQRCRLGPDQYASGFVGSTPVENKPDGALIRLPLWNCALPAAVHPERAPLIRRLLI